MNLDEMNKAVIAEFRANEGETSGQFENVPLLLINTIGAKSGEPRTKPLAYLRDGDRYVVIASFAGAEKNPPWYYNLVANPEFELEVGAEKFTARATVATEPERTELYARMAEMMPVFNDYQEKTKRVIPVFILERV